MRNRQTRAADAARPAPVPRETIRRTTALADAFVAAFAKQGVEIPAHLLPVKKEPAWRASKREGR